MSSTTTEGTLADSVRRGLAWSTLSNFTLRLGSLVVGIVLARLLDPEQFGVYAVALAVQTVLITLADLGLSADLIRARDFDRRAPTVAVLGGAAGLTMATGLFFAATPVAVVLGSPESASTIAVLGITVLIAGLGVVPYAALNRRFEQRKLFMVAALDFWLGTAVAIALILAGHGVISLAIGRVVGQAAALALQYRLAGVRLRVDFDATIVRSTLRFGAPVAMANLLSWALLSADTVIIARELGATVLGLYVLAFNIASWPMSTLGQVVRSVALPAFARHQHEAGRDPSLGHALGLAWAVGLPAGGMLSLLAGPLIVTLYGLEWRGAVPALVALGVFGAIRVAFDLIASYLLAKGAASATLWVQVLWFVSLVPAVLLGARWFGIVGAAWAHVLVAVMVISPVYVVVLHRVGADLVSMARSTYPPLLAMAPTALVTIWAASSFDSAVGGLLVGGALGTAVYSALMLRWVRARVTSRAALGPGGPSTGS